MKNIKWGFIGCGDVVEKKSGPAFSEVEGSSVVAVMSRSEGKARSYAERHGIGRWYKDAQELIDDDGNQLVVVGGLLWGAVPLWLCWSVFMGVCLIAAVFMFAMMKRLEKVC